MILEHWWNDTGGVQQKYWEKTTRVPLCPPKISHGLDWDRTRVSTSAKRHRKLRFVPQRE